MTSKLSLIISGVITLAMAAVLFMGLQTITVSASPTSYIAPTYGSPMLDGGDEAF